MILPKDAPWLAEFVSELLGFPNAKHDDQVDSLSQYLLWVQERPPRAIFEVSGPERGVGALAAANAPARPL